MQRDDWFLELMLSIEKHLVKSNYKTKFNE